MGHIAQKSPVFSGSFAGKNLQLKASYGSLPFCTDSCTYINMYIIQSIEFGVHFNLNFNLNLVGFFSIKRGQRDLEYWIND